MTYVLSDETAGKLQALLSGNDPTSVDVSANGLPSSQPVVIVTADTLSDATNTVYAGTLYLFDASTLGYTAQSGAIWVRGANGEVLTTSSKYVALGHGTYTYSGTTQPLYIPCGSAASFDTCVAIPQTFTASCSSGVVTISIATYKSIKVPAAFVWSSSNCT